MPYFHLFQQELNSIDLKTAKDIQRRLEAWSENDMITAVVLQGEGGCYCGGVDLDWLSAHREHTADLYAAVGDLYSSISKYPKPIVSMINGDVSGSGLGLAIVKQLCDAQGWDVAVQARAEGGAVFALELPRRD